MANFNELPKVTFQDIVAEANFGNLGYADTYLSPNFLTAPIIAWASDHAKSRATFSIQDTSYGKFPKKPRKLNQKCYNKQGYKISLK